MAAAAAEWKPALDSWTQQRTNDLGKHLTRVLSSVLSTAKAAVAQLRTVVEANPGPVLEKKNFVEFVNGCVDAKSVGALFFTLQTLMNTTKRSVNNHTKLVPDTICSTNA